MTVHRAWSHRPELAAEPSSVSSARAFVAGHPVDHEMADLVDDIELVVSELATNALVHAGSPFTVILGFAERRVLLEVLDGGMPDRPWWPLARWGPAGAAWRSCRP